MKLGIVVGTDFVIGTYALAQGDEVKIFLVGKGVEAFEVEDPNLNIGDNISPFCGERRGAYCLRDLS